MFRRINQGDFTESIGEKKYYFDKFVILNYGKYNFRDFKDYIDFSNIALSILPKIKIDESLKKYFSKILSIINTMENLCINKKEWDENHYKLLVSKSINNFDKTIFIEDEMFKIVDIVESNKENPSMDKISYNISNSSEKKIIEVTIPKTISNKYNFNIAGIVDVYTNDFYTDLFIEIIRMMKNLKTSITCPTYKNPITEEYVHVEIAQGFNVLIEAITYLVNCSSFLSNKLFIFDEITISKRIELSKTIIANALNI